MNILGTNITAPVVPFTTDDIFASHIDIYGKGGYRCVETLIERNTIPELRRSDMMLVAVIDEKILYQLKLNNPDNPASDNDINNNNNWVIFEVGNSGGDDWVFPPPISSSDFGEKGQRSFDDNFVYICIDNNNWKRIAMDYFVWSESTNNPFQLPNGTVPVWDSSDWSYSTVVKTIEEINTYEGTNLVSGLLITYTDNTQETISGIGGGGSGDNWLLPPPPSSSSPGIAGQRSYSGSHLYICVEDNVWKRINIDYFESFEPETTSGFLYTLPNGVLPIWNTGWEYDTVIKNIIDVGDTKETILSITETNGTNTVINIGYKNYDINDINDINIDNPQINQAIVYNGTNWINSTITNGTNSNIYLNDIIDVNVNTPTNKDIIQFKNGEWININNDKNIYTSLDIVEIVGDGSLINTDYNLYSNVKYGNNILNNNNLEIGNKIKSKIMGYYSILNENIYNIQILINNIPFLISDTFTISYPKPDLLFEIEYDINVQNNNIIGQGKCSFMLSSVSQPLVIQMIRSNIYNIDFNIDNTIECVLNVNGEFDGYFYVTNSYIEK